MTWHLYLLECKDGSYYAGIAKDMQARFKVHQSGKGAKYTRANPPTRILASQIYENRSAALIAEAQVKKLPRQHKLNFFQDSSQKT